MNEEDIKEELERVAARLMNLANTAEMIEGKTMMSATLRMCYHDLTEVLNKWVIE